MEKELAGRVTISRVTSSMREEEFMEITVQDKASGKRIVKAEISLADFATAITGGGRQDVKMSVLDDFSKLGMKKEIATRKLPYYSTNDAIFREGQKREAKKYEKDGWKLEEEAFNHHRALNGQYHATFIRYVEEEKA